MVRAHNSSSPRWAGDNGWNGHDKKNKADTHNIYEHSNGIGAGDSAVQLEHAARPDRTQGERRHRPGNAHQWQSRRRPVAASADSYPGHHLEQRGVGQPTANAQNRSTRLSHRPHETPARADVPS